MGNSVTDKLKQHLEHISDEQFAMEWEEVENLEIISPCVEKYFTNGRYFSEKYVKSYPPSLYLVKEEYLNFKAPIYSESFFLVLSHHDSATRSSLQI